MARRLPPPPPPLAPKCCAGFSACLGDQAGAAALGTPPLGELRLSVLSTASMSPPNPAVQSDCWSASISGEEEEEEGEMDV
jgi:hypothetical protein